MYRRRREPAVRSERSGIDSPAQPHRRVAGVVAVAAAAVLLAACGDDDTTEASTTITRGNTVPVRGTDRLAFEPDEFTIPAAEEVTLELTAASVEHDFVVEGAADDGTVEGDKMDMGDDPDDLHVAHADAGDTVTATFRIDKAGTYTVYCSVPGHRDAGMVASLEVIEPQG
jgi:uncharacterized cupredoxin-like copper-binding protein